MFYLLKPKLVFTKFNYNVQRRNKGWFAKIKMAKPDPIFGLVEDFKKDKEKKKVNLAIGVFRTDEDKPYILKCVRKAEKIILNKKMNKEYSPIGGHPLFNQLAMDFTFGKDCEYNQPGRNVTFQVLSGNGGLSITAQFLKKFYPGNKKVYIPDPTWPNHQNIFYWIGLKTATYHYYDPKNIALDFKGMLDDICCMPKKSIILFHASGHNPTGIDPTIEQWKEISDVIKKKKLYVIMDNAYQGFASGDIVRDAKGFRIMAKKHINMSLTTSFAKNMGLYGERVGATSFLVDTKEESDKILSHLLLLIRANHSNPPLHGGRIVTEIFCNPELKKLWLEEVKILANRIITARKQLIAALKKAGSQRNWDFIGKQIGMFSFTGLNKKQIKRLRKEFHIYASTNGRIAICGINTTNIEYVANAIHKVTS